VYAKDLFVDDSGEGEEVEDLLEALPNLNVEPPLALVVEAVDAVDRGALVVAAQQEEVFRVLDLVREQQAHALQPVLPAVHVVAEKEVVCLRREAAVLKEAQQVVVLPVDVAHDLYRRLQLEQRVLILDDLAALVDQHRHLVRGQVHVCPRLLFSGLQQLLDDGVQLCVIGIAHRAGA